MNNGTYIAPTTTFTEKADNYELRVCLPGIGKDEAELHLDGHTLTLKTHGKYQNPAGFKQVVAEFTHSDYAMSADLPELADPAGLSAKLENGILLITIPKRPETQAKRISIA